MIYTHTYKNKLGKEVKCFIDYPTNSDIINSWIELFNDFEVIVKNENGCGVYLYYSKLTKE
jgi:hypothetical protein